MEEPQEARVLEFGVLGPVEALRDGVALRMRLSVLRLLAALLCRAGQPVGVPALLETLWSGDAPPTARKTLQVYVHRLRRALGDDRLEHGSGGYRLVVAPEEVDALRFADLVRRAQVDRAAGRRDRARSLLREGLALWRGEPYAGLGAGGLIAEHAYRLTEERLLAHEDCIGVELDLGGHAEVAAELEVLTRAHPYREPLRGYLMLALYRTGRQVEALEAFRRTRALFVDELGIEPGLMLQRLHEAILRGEGMLATVPSDRLELVGPQGDALVASDDGAGLRIRPPVRQLPADVSGFTGRMAERKELDALLPDGAASPDPPTVPIAVLAGTAGVGKTALAVHWAHQVRDRFPDGQLYIDLCGYTPGPTVRPVEALSHFLRAFGVPAELIPADLAGAAGMYRSLLADKQVLVLLDNAASVEQVRPLLPAGPGCLVLVTSRSRLGGLVAREGARRVGLDVLAPDEAVALIVDTVGAARTQSEPEAAAELARLCAYLPLALRIAAANLVNHPQRTLAEYVARLRQGNLMTALRVEDDDQTALRAAFEVSYLALPAGARRLFRLIGVLPGADFTEEAAAVLAEVSGAEVEQLIDQLAAAHMVHQHAPGRYGCHDLLRLFARAQADEEEPGPAPRAEVRRLLGWYLGTASAAADLAYPGRCRLAPVPALAGPAPLGFTDRRGGVAWLDAERANLVSVARYLAEHGPHFLAWELAEALRGYLWSGGYAVEWRAVAEAALTAAEQARDPTGLAIAQLNLGALSLRQDVYGPAIAHLEMALPLAEVAGSGQLEATVLGLLGAAFRQVGRPRDAVELLTRALALERAAGQVQPSTVGRLGSAHWELGDLRAAAEHHAWAYGIYETMGSSGGRAAALANLGETHYLTGQPEQARDELERALALYRESGNKIGEVDAVCCVARIDGDRGRRALALKQGNAALALARTTGRPRPTTSALGCLGDLHLRFGNAPEAAELHRQALDLARQTGHRYPEAEALLGLAQARHSLGRLDLARQLTHQALGIAQQVGYRVLECRARNTLADIYLGLGRPGPAADEQRRALELHLATGYRQR